MKAADVIEGEFEMTGEEETKEVVPSGRNGSAVPANIMEHRDQLVARYHGGAQSLLHRLKTEGNTDVESLLVALLDEVIKESDHLLGNELVATGDGELQVASVISFKRAEVLEKAIKAVQQKQAFDKEAGFDLNSPSVNVLFRYILKKVSEVFETIGMRPEQKDLFFSRLGETTEGWQKEVRRDFDELRRV